jgi:putative NADH-flavin reductase
LSARLGRVKLVIVATGGQGRSVVADAVQRGHEVRALVRDRARSDLPDAVRPVQGDVLDPASLDTAVERRDAVICVLGTASARHASSLLEHGTRNLTEAMKRAGVSRLVCVTLLGTADCKRNALALYRHVILRVLGPMVFDKENQERVVRDSGLEWVLVCDPRRFVNRARAQPRVILSGENVRVGHVSRRHFAGVVIDAAERSGLCAPGNSRRLLT